MQGKTLSAKGCGKGKARQPPTLNELLEKLNRAKRIESGEADVQDVDPEPKEDDGQPKLGEGSEP